MENPNYYAIIPANVRYSNITPNAKLLYGEITALSNKNGFCHATNSYFADLYSVSIVSISKWIKELVDNDFITSDIKYKDGSKEILFRYLKMLNTPIKEKLNRPIKQKFKDNNTSINNTSINNINRIVEPPLLVDILQYVKEKGYKEEIAVKFHEYYSVNDWKDSKGNKVKNWKQKLIAVWFKDENKQGGSNKQKMVF
jgi:hypothetical protein